MYGDEFAIPVEFCFYDHADLRRLRALPQIGKRKRKLPSFDDH